MSRTAVFWANRVIEASGNVHPESILGEPDGQTQFFTSAAIDTFVKLGDFRGQFHSNLADLLS